MVNGCLKKKCLKFKYLCQFLFQIIYKKKNYLHVFLDVGWVVGVGSERLDGIWICLFVRHLSNLSAPRSATSRIHARVQTIQH